MTTNSEKLRAFIAENLENLAHRDGGSQVPVMPEFELSAQDYLEFAEQELRAYQDNSVEQDKTSNLINCVSHLKRAIDCQVDTFLSVYNLYNIFSNRNLKFEKKIEFLGAAGVFNARSLSRLNSIRNRMEHKFEIPEIDDIEVYYDLAVAFVTVLQRTLVFSLITELGMEIWNADDKKIGVFDMKYTLEKPSINASWKIGEVTENLTVDMKDPSEFAFFLKVLLFLYQQESFASNQYLATQIGG